MASCEADGHMRMIVLSRSFWLEGDARSFFLSRLLLNVKQAAFFDMDFCDVQQQVREAYACS